MAAMAATGRFCDGSMSENVRGPKLYTCTKFHAFMKKTTSDLESFQNHILMYAAKRYSYSPPVYRTYRRYFNKKKSKCWSVYTTKEKKQHSYIQDLQKAILGRRIASGRGLPRKQTLRSDDPRRLGLLAAVTPLPTAELVHSQVARGDTPLQ
ncbi:hypothetical protein N1851_016979 [Merluccius polli]|uniref:Uncharacterized protein n=1 Tax=Merluccius polli TaxID=89951 RepID=A0AA47P2M8_MERPO|nr:hypothetical protein N1851_016979 [Merluccius polli]